MFIFDLFRSFLPLFNPIGFGAADFVELFLALMLVVPLLFWRRGLQSYALRLAGNTRWCMLLLAILPIALRLALLPQYPIPSPQVADDFSYILSADTLRHFRLAESPHPMHEFFETFFVLQQPSYSSIFPLGQGFVLALGWAVFGHPWAGVALSIGGLCALCYWMLRAWITPGWALAGGLLAVAQFGPLNQWMNSYWGGAVSGCAGCLVFGAMPRLRAEGRGRNAVWLGLGLGLQLLTRPYEFVFLVLSVMLYFAPNPRKLARPARMTLLAMVPFAMLMLGQNRLVTGSWTTLPYQLSRYQYGVPTTFTLQPNPTPHQVLTHEQQLDYEAQSEVHGAGVDNWVGYWTRWASRVRFYRFFLLPPLYLALPAFLLNLREYRFACVAATVFLFSLGTNFYPYFYSHYVAALTCLFALASAAGLESLSRWSVRGQPVGEQCARIVLLLCVAHVVFWYGLPASRNEELDRAMTRYETSDAINHGDPEGRIAIRKQLDAAPGKQLVFVRYSPQHRFQEWVFNGADVDSGSVVWARDLGPDENQKLQHYYPDRASWLLEPDIKPPRLRPYSPGE